MVMNELARAQVNMLPMLGAIIGWPTIVGGLIVHAIMSIIFGLIFALVFDCFINSWLTGCLQGMFFGLGAWIFGPMLILPYLAKGQPLFSLFNASGFFANIKPLVGHIICAAVMGITYFYLKKRAKPHFNPLV